ncbi:MAG: response regulator [Deltaproteobacteria bacterium]|nr:response regulator [Deltaproteobacteria bacterium]
MQQINILVVEDNPVIRDLCLLGIEKLQHEKDTKLLRFFVEQAADGGSAWQYIQNNQVDLLVIDLYLPVLNGLELIRRIRKSSAIQNMKILAISASIQDARDRSLGAGANLFLQKPLRLVDLLEALRTLLNLPVP